MDINFETHLRSEIKNLRRVRKWLIITGIPLACVSLVFAFWMDPLATASSAIGMWVAARTYDLTKHEPLLDDGRYDE